MRRFEAADDAAAMPGVYLVLRADGRNFTRLTKDQHQLEAPFDERFRDAMIASTRRLFECGLRTIFGYTESDELSVLLHKDDAPFDRKLRKLDSVVAGEVSATFSLALGVRAAFDCRVIPLPSGQDVVDYFRWRMADATRNALSGWAYWTLRRKGLSARQATARLDGLDTSAKNELLFQEGINFNALPPWQRRGVGVRWATEPRVGVDKRTNTPVTAVRRTVLTELELPMKAAANQYLEARVLEAS
jgi:tRNA(His) 5'-end guanylyltransferase